MEAALLEVASPYFIDAEIAVSRLLTKANQLYLSYSNGGVLDSFFGVKWYSKSWHPDCRGVYLGLSATRSELQRSGSIFKVYESFVADAHALSNHDMMRVVCWTLTCAPSTFHGFHRLFEHVAPSLLGQVGSEQVEIRNHILDELGVERGDDEILRQLPFVSTYTQHEEEQMKEIERRYTLTLFDDLGMNRRAGDRLLLTGWVPYMPER